MSYRIEEKWGLAAELGFTQFPDLLLKAQRTLGISPTEFNVLMNVVSFWWAAEDLPFPSANGVANRIGMQPRTVRNALKGLEAKGLLIRSAIKGRGAGRHEFDLSPLVERLNDIASRDAKYLSRKDSK